MVLGEFQRGCGDIGSDLDVLGKNVFGVVTEAVDSSELVARTDTDRVSNIDGVHGDKSLAHDFNSVLAREADENAIAIAAGWSRTGHWSIRWFHRRLDLGWLICGEYVGNDSVFASLKEETVTGVEGVGASVQTCVVVSQDLGVVGIIAEVEHDPTIESITVRVRQNKLELGIPGEEYNL